MKVLLIEDEPDLVSLLHRLFIKENFSVSMATNGKDGLAMTLTQNYEVIVLDIMLPDLSGLEVLQEIRKKDATTPILLLTAIDTSTTIVEGLNHGADDYLVKPFKNEELIARLFAITRRNKTNISSADAMFSFKFIQINDHRKEVFLDNQLLPLTPKEYNLMLFMIKNNNRVLSRDEIIEHVWQVNFNMNTNIVDVYINYIRKKMEALTSQKLIYTVPGMGYIIK